MTRDGGDVTNTPGGQLSYANDAPGQLRGDLGAAGEGAHEPLPYSTQDFRAEITRVRRNRRVVGVLCAIAAVLVVAAIVAAVLLGIPGSVRVVDTDAMSPSIERGQIVLLQKVQAPNEGDVVVYRDAGGAEKYARVLAEAGAWVNISSDGSVVISEVSLEGATSSEVVNAGESIIVSRRVPDGACFVLTGPIDDPSATLASLDNPIAYRSIVGRVSYHL